MCVFFNIYTSTLYVFTPVFIYVYSPGDESREVAQSVDGHGLPRLAVIRRLLPLLLAHAGLVLRQDREVLEPAEGEAAARETGEENQVLQDTVEGTGR